MAEVLFEDDGVVVTRKRVRVGDASYRVSAISSVRVAKQRQLWLSRTALVLFSLAVTCGVSRAVGCDVFRNIDGTLKTPAEMAMFLAAACISLLFWLVLPAMWVVSVTVDGTEVVIARSKKRPWSDSLAIAIEDALDADDRPRHRRRPS